MSYDPPIPLVLPSPPCHFVVAHGSNDDWGLYLARYEERGVVMTRLTLGLSAEQLAKRQHCLGGSDANVIMNGDDEALLNLWLEKTGQREPEDLSSVLPVMMGLWTEELNRHWYELTTGRRITDEQLECVREDLPWMTCTLDGLTTTERGQGAIFEAKHVNAFSDGDTIAQRYMPQLHHNGHVRGTQWAVLSVFIGTLKYEFFEVELDPFYTAALIEREAVFWDAVQRRTPPVTMPHVEAPKVTAFREIDMTGSNAWAMHAGIWAETRDPAKRFTAAEKEIKALMEADVSRAWGHGVECKRAKNGALRISEMKR